MPNVLDEICAKKRAEIAERRMRRPLAQIEDDARNHAPAPRGFQDALARDARRGYGLITEIKKASPSKGVIRSNFDPAVLAVAYENGGATCLSVLTDEPYFQGRDAYLVAARRAVSLPVLRKDFMLDVYQIFEARSLGADCILLIMAALDDSSARDLEATALELGMDVLIEVHNQAELERACQLQSRLIGVNNRDLTTLTVDLATTEKLAGLMPKDVMVVSESGLSNPADLARMADVGVRCFLIGEALMREDDVTEATRALLAVTDAARQAV
ncbi:MAG: indole-3-glycerol phosphate synthase TrpC [Proteobacteria bacterium]|nr:indole-3-glycerol phosphate synthase TrpC [Pseudomonadota bacterium]